MKPPAEPEVLTLIPARGGSKGLPGKNIRPFQGMPLIAHSIIAARESGLSGRIVVSTDDPEIADVALAYGAEVPFLRPQALADDVSPVIETALHALDWWLGANGTDPLLLLLLQPTSPLRTSEDIRQAFRLIQSSDSDAVVSVTEAKAHPYWVKTIGAEGYLRPFVDGQTQPARRQDLPNAYALNGMLYLVKTAILRAQGEFCPRLTLPLIIPASRAIDIDSESDFLMAEFASGLPTS
jgi:CMP-N,N'-diacetyllegionaminic acid synthase